MNAREMPGALKVAILMKSLGEKAVSAIFDSLSQNEKDLVKSHLAQMGSVSPELAEKVAEEFIEMMQMRGGKTVRQVTDRSGNGGREEEGKGKDEKESQRFKVLQGLEPTHVAELIKDEHPQTIAIILAHLQTEKSGEVLAKLPDEKKVDVAVRIASLEKIVPGMVEEIDRAFEEVLRDKETSVADKRGGVGCLAEILNQLDDASGQMILNEIEENNPELAEQIKQKMFVFDDLILVDNQGLQKVLRKVESKEVAVALKAASDEVKRKIFENMSERASEMLREEMEMLGAVRMKDVEDAQQTITRLIQSMESKGEIVISGRRGEEIVS